MENKTCSKCGTENDVHEYEIPVTDSDSVKSLYCKPCMDTIVKSKQFSILDEYTKRNIIVETPVSLKDLSDLMCSAWEGGSAYWASAEEYVEPKEWTIDSAREFDTMKGKHFGHDYPFNEGGAVIVMDMEDDEQKTYRLDLEAVEKGAKIMAEKFPRHWGDFRKEDYDADTGDVFLQCCLFGDVIYG